MLITLYETPIAADTWWLEDDRFVMAQPGRCELLISGNAYVTLPETNIAPEIGPSQKETHLPTIHFQGLC